MVHDSKSCVRLIPHRGFKSHSLRHKNQGNTYFCRCFFVAYFRECPKSFKAVNPLGFTAIVNLWNISFFSSYFTWFTCSLPAFAHFLPTFPLCRHCISPIGFRRILPAFFFHYLHRRFGTHRSTAPLPKKGIKKPPPQYVRG